MRQILGYYSHQNNINPKREEYEYQNIRSRYKGFIINPSNDFAAPNPFEMNIYWRVIEQVSYIIVSTVNSKIGRTSFYEVKQGLRQGIPVHEIYSVGRAFRYRKVIGLEVVSEKNLKNYAKLISVPFEMLLK